MSRVPRSAHTPAWLFGALATVLCAGGFYVACSYPDTLQMVAGRLGFAPRAASILKSPLAGYAAPFPGSAAGRRMVAGLIGAAVCFLAAWGIGKYTSRREKRIAPGPARPLE